MYWKTEAWAMCTAYMTWTFEQTLRKFSDVSPRSSDTSSSNSWVDRKNEGDVFDSCRSIDDNLPTWDSYGLLSQTGIDNNLHSHDHLARHHPSSKSLLTDSQRSTSKSLCFFACTSNLEVTPDIFNVRETLPPQCIRETTLSSSLCHWLWYTFSFDSLRTS